MGDRPVNQGPSNMAYVVSMLSRYAGGPERIRRLRVRFLGNVFGGDRLVARGRVASVSDEGGDRLAEVEVWLERAEDDRVLEGTAVVAVG
jgi:acyl dehydratase